MDSLLAIAYLTTLVTILGILGWLVVRQIYKSRQLESVISDLQPKLQKETGTPIDYYKLGSVYLNKKLYAKAISEFEKSLKSGGEGMAEVHNALGFAYFSQQQFDLAIRKYKEAIALQPEYVIAINNLGHVYEKKKLIPQALESYQRVLEIAPDNETAKRRAASLQKRVS
ncbi:tetratricopeptide repeat protein [Synechococcus sp. PCC 7502]|uniref:tetratricopeptide repeat protein n=1 Tax=Synechococcus sp. PCC 7502 TaxID=1173263 RepID=UPI00029FA156|nr:tetratricopeptide repeat protein [Synechococcus sp. PCC 7502]AFY72630.1 tetratricopeptide repeat protein [Synechococcus sp. PCC 7502]